MNSSSLLLEQRTLALGWLTHGGELAVALKGDRARHSDVIWQLLVEAVEIIDKTPDNERRWLTSGHRSGGWNMVGMSREELIEIERIRLLSAMKPFDGQSRYSPQRFDVDRALGILEWMRWCNSARLPDRLRKAAIALARGGDQEIVHRLYCPTRRPNRQNIGEIKSRTIGFIQTGLRTDLGIIPGDGLTFVVTHPSIAA
jgi:hypothetical protein